MTLDQLKKGQSARITGVIDDGPLAQRLMAMGVLEGSIVRLVRKALGGDPIEVEVMGYALSLRSAEAQKVEIALNDE